MMGNGPVKEVRLLAATGMLGTGFPESSLRTGMAMDPHVIGCDSGTTDGGPDDLATGKAHYSAQAYRRDLGLMLSAARDRKIPLIIGSAGGAGSDASVNWTRDIVEDVAGELGLTFRLALIYASQDRAYLKRMLAQGRIRPLSNAPTFDASVIDRSIEIVGMMGCEPMIRALENGADVVLAGRASDTSIYAALPMMLGLPGGPAWHAGKILECGAAAVEHRLAPDCMFAAVSEDGFVVQAPNEELECTPVSVAAHSLYENADPFRMTEPSGTLDLSECRFEAVRKGVVRVTGSRFIPAARYSVKLEGVELVGYQSIIVSGIRDPLILEQLDSFLDIVSARILQRVRYTLPEVSDDDWSVKFRIYGKNGVLGALEPLRDAPVHEVGLIIEVTAMSQEIANVIAPIARHQTLHNPVPEWSGMVSNIAMPYGTTALERGPVYQFNVNSVVEPADPYEMFRMEMIEVTPRRFVTAVPVAGSEK